MKQLTIRKVSNELAMVHDSESIFDRCIKEGSDEVAPSELFSESHHI